jgi:hypothetical protein
MGMPRTRAIIMARKKFGPIVIIPTVSRLREFRRRLPCRAGKFGHEQAARTTRDPNGLHAHSCHGGLGPAWRGGESKQRVIALGSAAARLSRTYATQVETLRRLRGAGAQHVRVEHVHIYEQSQAVVGIVNAPKVEESRMT